MDTNVALDVFINNGMLDKAAAKDIKDEMSNSGKELWETLIDFGIIGAPEDFWNVIATEVGARYITLQGFTPPRTSSPCCPHRKPACTERFPSNTEKEKDSMSAWRIRSTPKPWMT